MGSDHAFNEIFVGGIADEQRHVFGQKLRKAGGQVIDDDHAFAGIHQRTNRVASDVTRAAGDQYCHRIPIRIASAPARAPYFVVIWRGLWSEVVAGSLLGNDGNGV